ncbi:MAG TPA: phosphatidate cytidylyltransferase [Erysipelothrix sp.]
MKERMITGVVLALILLGAFLMGNQALFLLMVIFLGIGSYEIYRTKKESLAPIMIPIYGLIVVLGAFIPAEYFIAYYSAMVLIYFTLAIIFKWFTFDQISYSFVMTSLLVGAGIGLNAVLALDRMVFLYVLIASFATDIFAYFGGRQFGKHKLIERLSPNKTVEGAISGYVMGVVLSFTFGYFMIQSFVDIRIIVVASLLMPLFSQIGDLSFSLVKRRFNIKDFGTIFPGHGGVLDRIDSVVFAVLTFNIVLTILS